VENTGAERRQPIARKAAIGDGQQVGRHCNRRGRRWESDRAISGYRRSELIHLPIGDWTVTVIKHDPAFFYNPNCFGMPIPAIRRPRFTRPNNPVGLVWIGSFERTLWNPWDTRARSHCHSESMDVSFDELGCTGIAGISNGEDASSLDGIGNAVHPFSIVGGSGDGGQPILLTPAAAPPPARAVTSSQPLSNPPPPAHGNWSSISGLPRSRYSRYFRPEKDRTRQHEAVDILAPREPQSMQ